MAIDSLVRKSLKELAPYSSARSEYSGKADVWLDANENSFGSATDQILNRYPDPSCKHIRSGLSEILSVSADQIIIGNGSDEIISMLCQVFCDPSIDSVLVMPPTFGMYSVIAKSMNITIVEVPLTPTFDLDIEEVIAEGNTSKIIFICSPNNPTGTLFSQSQIAKILESSSALVVVDEAYIEFSGEASSVEMLSSYENLFVLRTFSKAWGLAGARVGYGVGAKQAIHYLNSVKLPYNVNSISQSLALEALSKPDHIRKTVEDTSSQRNILYSALQDLDCVSKVYNSDANFLLVKFKNCVSAYKDLLAAGIVVRDVSNKTACEGCLRITVGTGLQNSRLVEVLEGLA